MSLLGLPIGFYGYLFPGNINIMVLDLYGSKKYKTLLMVLFLVVIFESAYCLTSLFYLNQVKTSSLLYSIIEIVAYLLVLVMGFWMLFEDKSNVNLGQKNTLYRGILNIIIHPQQIPFWIVTGVIIHPILNFGLDRFTMFGFMLCNALGTLLVMTVYMIYGNRLMQYFKVKLNQLNTAMGILYVALALFSLGKIFIY